MPASARRPWLALLLVSMIASGAPARAQSATDAAPAAPAAPAQPLAPEQAAPLRLSVTLDPSVLKGPYTGRVYVSISQSTRREPRTLTHDWFNPAQTFAVDVAGVEPGGTVTLDASALHFPRAWHEMPAGDYRAQAFIRLSIDGPNAGLDPGDAYSDPVSCNLDPRNPADVALVVNRVLPDETFEESERIRYFEMVSPSLSAFHGREVKIRAGVLLPTGWDDNPQQKYPCVYVVTGFGGTHEFVRALPRFMGGDNAERCLLIVPDPMGRGGHNVFADSANNGPWGTALVREFIPAVERQFRGAGSARHRYVTGVSSGGWSSLWLQVAYPDDFNGCWSHVPDPVDFRDFQRINLYAPDANMYRDENGAPRPLARQGEQVMITYERFVKQETVLGRGGQIHSFEAVFSPRGQDGLPLPLFDRETGCVHPDVAKSWEKYDIRLVLERHWAELGPKLTGKLRVWAGEVDTFYLEGATRLLKESLANLGSDALVEIVPGMAHSPVRSAIEDMFAFAVKNAEEAGLLAPMNEGEPQPAAAE